MEFKCRFCNHVLCEYEINCLWCSQCDHRFASQEEIMYDPVVEAKKIAEIQEQQKQRLAEEKQRLAEVKRILVTTTDLHEDYEIIGPVFYQLNNRTTGFLKSKLSELKEKYQEIANINHEEFNIGIFSALFTPFNEFGPGETEFSTAFYIAVEELKLQAHAIGADAIIGMRQDIDIDSNGNQNFYLQIYGTAVKRKKEISS